MNKEVEKIPLTFKEAHRYVIDCLQDGHALAQAVFKLVDFEKGHFFAVVNSLADRNKIYEFHKGGILPPNPLEPIMFNEQTYPGRKKAHSAPELAEYIQNAMNLNQCCFFDDVVHIKSDPLPFELKKQTLYFQDEVYFYMKSDEFTNDLAKRLILYSDAQWYYMNIISTVDPGLNTDLKEDKIQKIAAQTTHIVVGAYDMEGYVVWANHE